MTEAARHRAEKKGTGENFLASDIPAFLLYTRDVVFLDNGELAEVEKIGRAHV